MPPPQPTTRIQVISYPGDEVKDLDKMGDFGIDPFEKIVGPLNQTIAPNWQSLWDGSIDLSLFSTSVVQDGGFYTKYWTGTLDFEAAAGQSRWLTYLLTNAGSNPDGTLHPDHCDGGGGPWTSSSSALLGRTGGPAYTDGRWISYTSYTCNSLKLLLCACSTHMTPTPTARPSKSPTTKPSTSPSTSKVRVTCGARQHAC
jgi:hypothetical protein